MNDKDSALVEAIKDHTYVLSIVAKEIALLVESQGTSCGRQVGGVLIDEMDKYLRDREKDKE